jgi:hypothetical protein
VMEEGERRRGKRRSRYRSVLEEHTKRRSKRGSTISSDGEAINAGGQRSKWIDKEDCGGVK